jgi:TolA-binding protein
MDRDKNLLKNMPRRLAAGRAGCLLAATAAALMLSATANGAPSTSTETNLFNMGAEQLKGGLYPQSEMTFSNFVVSYTNSALFAQAALCEARARMGQSNYSGAIELLQTNLPAAGSSGADYIFWIAEAHFQRGEPGDYDAAIIGCTNLLNHYPASELRLQAAYFEALSYFKKGDVARGIELLSAPEGAFASAARGDTNSDFAASGLLLLSEGFLAQRQY